MKGKGNHLSFAMGQTWHSLLQEDCKEGITWLKTLSLMLEGWPNLPCQRKEELQWGFVEIATEKGWNVALILWAAKKLAREEPGVWWRFSHYNRYNPSIVFPTLIVFQDKRS